MSEATAPQETPVTKEQIDRLFGEAIPHSKDGYRSYLDVFLSERYRKLHFVRQLNKENQPPIDPQAVQKFFQEGCLVRSIMMGVGGYGLGLLFGSFMFTMRPVDIDTTLPFREQVKQSYKGMGTEVLASAKNFAKIGMVYSLVECFIERGRGRRDLPNALYAGCITGGALAWRGGPWAMAGGCSMFAAFSLGVEYFMHSNESSD
eukprot:GDKI01014120.1.p1 GENE.GDKI01014120.1~~GDKI01014120.1.p1  ORF type:complete len:204 (-),score=24.66 GDKI01014120.1:23-634(-)